MKKKFVLGNISKYRNELFGVAIISIMIFHFTKSYVGEGAQTYRHVINPLADGVLAFYYDYISTIGVDVFVFLSGMGLYYSLSHNTSIRSFYKKRFIRIVPAYLLIAVPFWFIRDIVFKNLGTLRFLGDLTFVTYFTRGVITIWYIGFIMCMYFLYPLIHTMIESRYKYLWLFIMFALYSLGYYMIPSDVYHDIYMAYARIPTFILGAYFAPYIKGNLALPAHSMILYLFVSIALRVLRIESYLDPYFGLWVNVNTALLSIVILVLFLEKIEVKNRLHEFLLLAGGYSLELYMSHITIRNLFALMWNENYQMVMYLLIIVLSLIVSTYVHKMCIKINSRILRPNIIS